MAQKLELSAQAPAQMGEPSLSSSRPEVFASAGNAPLVGDNSANKWQSLSPKQRKMIVIGASIGLVVLATITLLSVIGAGHSHRCSLQSSIPNLGSPRAVYTEPGAQNMAKLAGYIYVYDRGFLPLEISKVSIGGGDTGRIVQTARTIVLEDDCVRLVFDYNNFKNESAYLLELDWNFIDAIAGSGEPIPAYDGCDKVATFEHSRFPVKFYRYSCLERQAYQCRKYNQEKTLYAFSELVIKSLELEIDGDPEKIRQGDFSKLAYSESCNK